MEPSKPLIHAGQEVVASGYRAVWFLFNGNPYDIGRFYRPDGTWTGYYVDILEPVFWHGDDPRSLLPLVDLFLDLWISPEGETVVLDEDEFEAAVRDGSITDEQHAHARHALARLLVDIRAGSFPPALVRECWQ